MVTIILAILISAYPWPIRPFGSAHPVNATLGDARGSVAVPRFHNGIDIAASVGTKVYSIASNTAIVYEDPGNPNQYVRVGNYCYLHITPGVDEGDSVLGILDTTNTPPDTIGSVLDYPNGDHLHFMTGPAGGPYENPLSYEGGPVNYADSGMPIVWPSSDDHWWFWQSGSEGQIAQRRQSPLWGKVDLRSYCQDRQTSGGINTKCGIYRLEWLVKDRNTGASFGPFQTIIFPQVQPPNNGAPVLLVYDRHNYRDESPFYYWVTNPILNDQVKNHYWNTKLRKGEDWDGDDARINAEAEYPDGDYRVWVMAYDIKENGGDTLNRSGAEDEDISIDNFKPYVDRLRLEQIEKVIKYEKHWELNGNQLKLIEDVDDYCKPNEPITFYLYFSEKMNTEVHPKILVAFNDENNTTKLAPPETGLWMTDDMYAVITDANFIPDGATGGEVRIENAFDLASNEIDGDPQTIAYRDPSDPNKWFGYENPPDKSHIFKISGPESPPQISSTDPNDGEEKIDVNVKIKLTFNKKMNQLTVNPATVLFNPSLSGAFTVEWDEEVKTATLTLTSPEEDLKFFTDYEITVTDGVMDSSGIRLDGDKDGEPGGNYMRKLDRNRLS